MDREVSAYDQARGALATLAACIDDPKADLTTHAQRERICADYAIATGLLAIAEALRGVVYVANAGTV